MVNILFLKALNLKEIENNEESILKALKNDGYSLQYLSDELQNKKLIMRALKNIHLVNYNKFKLKNNKINYSIGFYGLKKHTNQFYKINL